MIKKSTTAIFLDGEYKGKYDWKGGIPLTVGETMTVHLNDAEIVYKLEKKSVDCFDDKTDQEINVVFEFKKVK